MRPLQACSTPGCGGLTAGEKYCADCLTKQAGPATVKQPAPHDYHREWRKLYNCKRWRDLRDAILRRDPVCKVCNRKASTVADHVKDHRGDTTLFYDPKNLQGSCKPCHDERTGTEHGYGGKDGNRPPPMPGLVGGRVVDYAPKTAAQVVKVPASLDVTSPAGPTGKFDYLAAIRPKE